MPAAVSGAQHEPRAYPAALSRNQTTAAVPPSASAPGTVRCPRVNGLPAPPGVPYPAPIWPSCGGPVSYPLRVPAGDADM